MMEFDERKLRDHVFEALGTLETISTASLNVDASNRLNHAKMLLRKGTAPVPVETVVIPTVTVTTCGRVPNVGRNPGKNPQPHAPMVKKTEDDRYSVMLDGRYGKVMGYRNVSIGDVLKSLKDQIQDMTYTTITRDAEMLIVAAHLLERAYIDPEPAIKDKEGCCRGKERNISGHCMPGRK